jgi:hypothetical protein
MNPSVTDDRVGELVDVGAETERADALLLA